MKKSYLRQIIKEEYRKILKESIDTDIVAHAARTATFPIRPTSKAEQFQKEIIAGGPYNKISDVISKINQVTGNNSQLRKYIEAAEKVLKARTGLNETSKLNETDLGAFRRMVITSTKADAIQKDFEALLNLLHARSEFQDLKVDYKKGVAPNTIVVDINGNGATALANKFKPLVGKQDKSAILKIKNQKTTVPAK